MLIITYTLLLSLVDFGFENIELIDGVALLLRELVQELLLLGQELISRPLMLLDDNGVMPLTFGFIFLVALLEVGGIGLVLIYFVFMLGFDIPKVVHNWSLWNIINSFESNFRRRILDVKDSSLYIN